MIYVLVEAVKNTNNAAEDRYNIRGLMMMLVDLDEIKQELKQYESKLEDLKESL